MKKKTQNILLFWNGVREEAVYIIEELKKHSLNVVYIVIHESVQFDILGVTVHLAVPARNGEYAPGVDITVFDPPSADLISKLYKAESLAITMMNRKAGKPGREFTVDEKKHFYYDQVRYWHGILKSFEVDFIVYPSTPHNIPSFVSYSLAHILGVGVLMLEWTWVSNRVLISNRYEEDNRRLTHALRKNEGKTFAMEDLSADIREYYETQINSAKNNNSVYAKYHDSILQKRSDTANRWRLRVSALVKSIKDGTFFVKATEHVRMKIGSNLKKEYETYVVQPALTKKFVYVPLHLQPECTTSPLGEMFADQILMVETLSSALPPGWFLYVKEHPSQWATDKVYYFSNMRYKGYYEKLASIHGVSIVPIDTDTFTLCDASQAVATVTGTALTEAVYRGKPAIAFGYPWFRSMPGVFSVTDKESCRQVFLDIERGYTPDFQALLNYFKSFGEATIFGYNALTLGGLEELQIGESKEFIQSLRSARDKSVNEIIKVIVEEAALLK